MDIESVPLAFNARSNLSQSSASFWNIFFEVSTTFKNKQDLSFTISFLRKEAFQSRGLLLPWCCIVPQPRKSGLIWVQLLCWQPAFLTNMMETTLKFSWKLQHTWSEANERLLTFLSLWPDHRKMKTLYHWFKKPFHFTLRESQALQRYHLKKKPILCQLLHSSMLVR